MRVSMLPRRVLIGLLRAMVVVALLLPFLARLPGGGSPVAQAHTVNPRPKAVTIGGVDLGSLTDYLLFFGDGRSDANWQGATKGFVGDVAVNGIVAAERTSGGVPFAGTVYTNDSTLSAWQNIVNANAGQAFASTGNTTLINNLSSTLNQAFLTINALPATPGFGSVSSTSLNGLNTQNGVAETFVINVTSGLQVSSQIRIAGDPGDVFILRWDTDADPSNGYNGQVKFQSGGAIIPMGGLSPANFIHVAGDINSSGGGGTPSDFGFPQGPRLDNGQGSLASGAANFSGGGFFTGYWLTTGSPTNPADGTWSVPYGATSSLSNGIFIGGWYSITTQFSMTSGTSGVHVGPLDYGDLPENGYLTTRQTSGPSGPAHVITDKLFLGTTFATDIDSEGDGQPNASASGDNLVNQNDEQAVTFPSLIAGLPANVTVSVTNNIGTTATLYGFIDWNGDGDFNDTGEAVTTTVPNGTVGNVTLTFNVPLNAVSGVDLGARFRLSTSGGLGPTDPAGINGPIPAPNGEVEDYLVQVTLGTATPTATVTPTNTALPTPTRTVTPTNTPDNTDPGGGESLSGVRGVVFNDLNSNGTQEPGEAGMNGVLVQLFGPGPDGLLNTPDDVLVAQMTTITSAGVPGSYSFLGVNPGLYRVRETTPAGYTATTPTNVGVLLVANITSVVDFGNVIPSATVTATPTATATATATSAAPPTVTPTSAPNTGNVTALVYRDLNNNGVQDVGEPGVAGVIVQLYAPGPDGILGTPDDVLLSIQMTDGGGNAAFYSLPPGIYRVSETVPPGYTATTPTNVGVSVSAGGTVAVKFGINLAPPTITVTPTPTATSTPALSTVAGTVFNDLNGNGVQDAGEPGLNGVTVQLVNPSTNAVVATTTTSPSGVYLFQNVTAGPYIVRETTPVGFTPTTPTNVPVFAPAGGVAIADFGNQQTGRVVGTVFNDVNGDGVQNVSEVGVSGVTVQLVNPSTNTVVATTTTGANGNYAFTGVAAGPYIVRETTPAGFTPTTPTNLPVSVPAGGSASADFGVQQTGTINGVVYYDHNMNGVQDGPESGLGGVVVSLYGPGPDNVLGSADDVLLATTTTVAGGGYSFSPVSAGSYLVRQTVPLGYVPTTPIAVPVVVPAGGAGQANFGDVQTGLVNGTVFYDWNGSTAQDPGEAGVPGVTVQLYSPGSDGFLGTVDDILTATTTTTSNGTYSFTAVTPGSYLVRELTPAGFTTTTPTARPVVVPPNGVGVADFGLLQVGALSGVVFNDLNGNGVQEPSEPGMGGVTVDLLNPNTLAVIGTTTTAGDGRYGFSALTPGSYLVRETDPAGFSSTTPNQVAAFVPANGAATVDFGDRAIGTISGVSFYDWNANGVQDPGETGIGGVTIQLVDPSTSTILATTTTAVSDGSYLFTSLAAGAYQVRETDPLGFTSTTPNQVNVTLPVGGSGSADFGNRATSSVAGVVFNDVDGSGLQEFSEVGLSGVTVTLVSAGPDNLFNTPDDVTVATATTLPDGRYQFLGLTPGTYQVRETDPAGFVSTTPNTVTVTAPLGGIGTANFGDQLRQQPTAVQVTAFTATAAGRDITLRWTTGNEVGVLGFQVWRSAQRDGDYRQVAPALLPAQAASGGADYKVVERGLSAGVWYYRVTLIGLDGLPLSIVGPLRVKVAETPADRPSGPFVSP